MSLLLACAFLSQGRTRPQSMFSFSIGVQVMKFHTIRILRALAMTPLLVALQAHADWAQSTDPLVIQPAPRDYQIQAQNPPGFTWARHPNSPASYDIQILMAGTTTPITATV